MPMPDYEAIHYAVDGTQMMNFDIAQDELRHHTMEQAVNIAQKSWNWRFKSAVSKMKDITLIYEWLVAMMEYEEQEPENPDVFDIEEDEIEE